MNGGIDYVDMKAPTLNLEKTESADVSLPEHSLRFRKISVSICMAVISARGSNYKERDLRFILPV